MKSSYRTTANYLQRPLLPIRYNYIRATKPYTPRRREACDEPLIPHSTRQPGYTCAAFRLPLHLARGVHRGPRLGLQNKTPSFILHSSRCSFRVEIMLQAGRPQARCIHVQDIGREGQAYTTITESKNARKHGTNGRQGKIGNQGL